MPKKNDGKTDPYGAHEGSLSRTSDPAVKRKIAAGRRKMIADQRSMRAWAAGGFQSGLSGEEYAPDDGGREWTAGSSEHRRDE